MTVKPLDVPPEEKLKGRLFRDCAQARLTRLCLDSPADYSPPTFQGIFRHPCPARKDMSTALPLKEVYVFSSEPIPPQCPEDLLETADPRASTEGWDGSTDRFGFIYKEGTCKLCHKTARSKAGWIVDAHERPPLHGKVARSDKAVTLTTKT